MTQILERMKRSMNVFARDLEPWLSLLVARFIVWRVVRREAHR